MSFDDMDMPKLNLDLSTDPDMAVYMKKRSMENLHERETDDDDEDDDEEEYSDDDAGDGYVTIGDDTDVPAASEQVTGFPSSCLHHFRIKGETIFAYVH